MKKKHVRKWYNQDWYQYIIRDFCVPELIANIYNLINSKPYKIEKNSSHGQKVIRKTMCLFSSAS